MAHLELAKKRTGRYKRKALVIGIDEYKIKGANLAGCVNDANDVVNTLVVCGFPPSQIHKITNERATKARVLKELAWLVKNAKPGDVLVYYHSGHGSQKTDRDGDEESDNIDEMVILHDFDWADESTHFIDDDFHREVTMKVPKGVRLEFILDTCHSGTGARSVLIRQGLDRVSRYLPNPDQQHILNSRLPNKERRTVFVKDSLHRAAGKEDKKAYAVWSACQANQLAWELAIDNNVRGAFTYNFCTIMRKREGNITRQSFYELLRLKMANDGYDQTPNIEFGTDEALEQYAFRRNFEDDATEIPESK